MPKAYHWKDGVIFERQDDGRVVIMHRPNEDDPPLWVLEISGDDWINIVLAMMAKPQVEEGGE